MSKPEPLPCPFCGTPAAVTYGRGPAGKYANIRCACGVSTKPVPCEKESEGAVKVCAIWNARSE